MTREMSADRHSIVAIITARGGSKGLPRKNLALLRGRPLIFYAIDAALGCSLVSETYVTTEDREIAAVSRTFGANVLARPQELATDRTSSYAVVRHALENLATEGKSFANAVLLQPTSPLRTAHHLSECLSAFFAGDYASAVSVCEAEHHPFKMLTIDRANNLRLIVEEASLHKPRQELPKVYRQNGAIYAVRCEDFLTRANGFLLDPAMPFVMKDADSIDIDTEIDLILAETIMNARFAR